MSLKGTLALLLGLVTGCGGGSGGGAGDARVVIVDFSLPPSSPHAAFTEYDGGEIAYVRVRPDQEFLPQLPVLLVHELEHAVGLEGHFPEDSGCYRQPDVFTLVPGQEPCVGELEQMLGVEGTWTVRVSVNEATLGPAVAYACSFWEARVGRDDLFDFEYTH